jgi:hypothetical protein
VHGPAIAAGAGGVAVAAWSRRDSGPYRIEVAVRPAGADFAAPEVLSGTSGDAYGPVAAVGPAGDTAVAWYEARAGGFAVRAASGTAARSFTAAQDLTASGDNAVEPRLEGSPGGFAMAWSAGRGSGSSLQTTGYERETPDGNTEEPSPAPPESPAPLDLLSPPAPAAVLDRLAPRVSYFAVTPRFAVAPRRPASAERRARVGGRLRFGLSEPALVTVAISRRLGPPEGTFGPRYARAGDNVLVFSGRLGGRALPRGRHRATIVAIDGAGNRSERRRDTFVISKGPRKR